MSNLIPMAPSQKDIQEMARLRSILEGSNLPAVQQPIDAHYSGGYAGTQRPLHESRNASAPYSPSYGTSREEVDAMKNLLTKLNELGGEEVSARRPITESAHSPVAIPSGTSSYSVLVTIKESNGKEISSYNVVDETRRDVVPGLTLKEAATAIMKLMNKGFAYDSPKVQEVIELEEEYNRNRIELSKHRQRYQKSVDLGERAAADVFKQRFNTAKANALAAQDSIQSINESIR